MPTSPHRPCKAYWLACADAPPVLRQRDPDAANRLVHELQGESPSPCPRGEAEAAHQFAGEGWASRSCARGANVLAAEGELGLGSPGLAAACRSRNSHFLFENACCFPPWLRPLEPLCTLSPVRLPVCGLRQSLRMQRAPLHPTSCTLQLMRRYLRLPLSRIYIHCGAKAETVVGLRSMHMGTATRGHVL